MKFKYSAIYAAILSATIGMAGCSSNDSSSSTATNVTGRITGFGSVYVDGVEYETDGSVITGDGTVINETDLHIGMIVTVNGTDDGTTGTAFSIEYNDDLEGIVTANDGTTLEVMGYSVSVDANTNFEGLADLSEAVVGSVVEISGYPDGTGGILATLVELKSADYTDGDEIEVKGVIANLDTTAMTFTIESMTVDYSGASLDFTIADGLYVEVKSDQALDSTTGNLMASIVELENNGESGHDGDDGEEISFEGVVAAIDETAGTITIGDDVVTLPDGFDVSSFAIGDVVDVDVVVVGDDLVADQMDTDDHYEDHAGEIQIEATLDGSEVGTNSITLMGITFLVDGAFTTLEDGSENGEHYFNLDDLVTGDRLEVEGYPADDGSGNYIATSMERKAATTDAHFVLKGNATVTDDGVTTTVSIAGVTLDLSNLTTAPTITDGTEVEAVGSYDGTTLSVTEIGIED